MNFPTLSVIGRDYIPIMPTFFFRQLTMMSVVMAITTSVEKTEHPSSVSAARTKCDEVKPIVPDDFQSGTAMTSTTGEGFRLKSVCICITSVPHGPRFRALPSSRHVPGPAFHDNRMDQADAYSKSRRKSFVPNSTFS